MLRYILKRIVMLIPVLLGVMIVVFFFQSISPEDPVDILLGLNSTPEARELKREELGLNDPIIVQFGRYVWNFVTKGDLGTSYTTNTPVSSELMIRFPITIKLALLSVALGAFIGAPLGILAAEKQYSWLDSTILSGTILLDSIPGFWLGLMCISLFAVKLHLLPTSGIMNKSGWVLPIVIVSIMSMSTIARTTRSSMLETIKQDYIRTARAKGQREVIITFRHALRNSLVPIIAMIGNTVGVQLGGSLVIETVFGLPGIGKYAVDAVSARNYPAVLGSVVVLAFTFTLVNLAIDIIYTIVDPRLKTTFFSARKKHIHSAAKGALSDG